MNQLSLLQHPDFGEIRVETQNDELWFCANDVCRALGYNNSRSAIQNHCFEEDVDKIDTLTKGGVQSINYVNESGLYALIFNSEKQNAKKFKHWVTKDILPSIRKTGSFHVEPRYGQTLLTRGELQNETLNFSSAVLPEIAKIEQGPLRNRLAGLVSYYISKIS